MKLFKLYQSYTQLTEDVTPKTKAVFVTLDTLLEYVRNVKFVKFSISGESLKEAVDIGENDFKFLSSKEVRVLLDLLHGGSEFSSNLEIVLEIRYNDILHTVTFKKGKWATSFERKDYVELLKYIDMILYYNINGFERLKGKQTVEDIVSTIFSATYPMTFSSELSSPKLLKNYAIMFNEDMKVSSGSIEKMQSEILDLQSQIDDRRESLNELELKKAHITSEISQLQAEYKEQENYRVTFEALSQSYKDVVESVNKCEELKKDLEASVIEAQSKIDEMDLAGVEEDDEEHYKEVHHLLRDFKSKLEDCIKYKDTYSKRESDIKTELNKIQVKIIDASTILDKIKTVTCNLDQINAQCNNMVSALESLYNELTPLKTDVNVAINAVEDLEVKNTINTSNVIDIFSTAGYSLNETRVLNFLIASVYYDKHKRYDAVVDNAGKNTSEPEFIIASLKSLLGV